MKRNHRASFYTIALSALLVLSGCGRLFGPSGHDSATQVEEEIFQLVNNYRSSLGKSGLAWNDKIAGVARSHSREMADGACPFGHDGFEERVAEISTFIPYARASENIALAGDAEDAVQAWIDSPSHRVHLEESYDLTGVGAAANAAKTGFYITQIFIKRR
jgi:uncharacterized protein YkwD